MMKITKLSSQIIHNGIRRSVTTAAVATEAPNYDKILKDKVAVITGSTKGVGFEVAKRMALDGAHVVVSSRSEENVKNAVKKLTDMNLSVSGMTCQIKSKEDRKRLLETTEREHGKIDVVVPNVGVDTKAIPGMMDATEEDFDEMFNLNLKSIFFMTKEAFPYLKKTEGCVTLLTTGAAYVGQLESNLYFLSKSTEGNLTKAFVQNFLQAKVRINAVALGLIDTEQCKDIYHLQENWEKYKAFVALGRMGTAEECAGMVAFLSSPDASYITGETFSVGGGLFYRL